jgi:hypothetical protein
LPLDPRLAGSNPAENYEFLRAIKICNTPSFGGELKPSIPRSKIIWHFKEPYEHERDTSYAKLNSNL